MPISRNEHQAVGKNAMLRGRQRWSACPFSLIVRSKHA